jgi:rubredoxin
VAVTDDRADESGDGDDGDGGDDFDDAMDDSSSFETFGGGENDGAKADSEDPFEEIDASEREPGLFESFDADERGTDPFEEIDDEWGAPGSEPDELAEPANDIASGPTVDPEESERDDADPFDGVGPGGREGDPFDRLDRDRNADGKADQSDEEIWESLSRSEAEPETERRGQRRFAEVSKHSYCESCEYFSEPPEIECGHEGTDIVEFLDSETVRVADCPIVTEREELAEIGDEI